MITIIGAISAGTYVGAKEAHEKKIQVEQQITKSEGDVAVLAKRLELIELRQKLNNAVPFRGGILARSDGSTASNRVRKLQLLLGLFGYNTKMDGIFGGHTEEMVLAVQKELGIKVDGKVGNETWQALLEKLMQDKKGQEFLDQLKIAIPSEPGTDLA